MSRLSKYIPSANSLIIFEAAARLLNFRLVAEELRMTQPNVSLAVKAMEQHMGILLFNRGNRGVSLTPAGEQLYAGLSPAIEQIEHSLRNVCAQDQHVISVAASTSVAAQWLLPLIAEYQRSHSGMKIQIITTDRNMEPGQEVDFSIRRGPRHWQRNNAWHIADETLYSICSASYLQSAPALTDLRDLQQHRIIHNREPYRQRLSWQQWLASFDITDMTLPESLVLGDYQLVLQACMAGEGVALGWSVTSAKLIEQEILVQPLTQRLNTDYAFYVLGAEQIELPAAKRQFAEWLCQRFKSNSNLTHAGTSRHS